MCFDFFDIMYFILVIGLFMYFICVIFINCDCIFYFCVIICDYVF